MAAQDITWNRAKRATLDRSLVVTPLLNLAATRPTGATLRHHRPILPIGDSCISGTAMLSLTPDHRSVEVCLWFDRPVAAMPRLRRLASGDDEEGGVLGEDELLIVEIVASASPFGSLRADRRFSLDERQSFGTIRTEDVLNAGVCLSELRAGSVDGVRAEPALASPPATQAPYYGERMRVEIEAAERSLSAVAASRHVELAILYARGLHGARA